MTEGVREYEIENSGEELPYTAEHVMRAICESSLIEEEHKEELLKDLRHTHTRLSERFRELDEQLMGVPEVYSGAANDYLRELSVKLSKKYGDNIARHVKQRLEHIYLVLAAHEHSESESVIINTLPEDVKKDLTIALERAREEEDFALYSKGVIVGWLVAIATAILADRYGMHGPVAEGAVRLIAGCGDSIGGSIGLVGQRITKKIKGEPISGAETFALGTLVGTAIGPVLHLLSEKILGPGTTQDVWRGGIVASMYSNADNFGGALASLLKSMKEEGLAVGLKKFCTHPFQVMNLAAAVGFMGAAIGTRSAGHVATGPVGGAIEGALLNNDTTLASWALLTKNYLDVRKKHKEQKK